MSGPKRPGVKFHDPTPNVGAAIVSLPWREWGQPKHRRSTRATSFLITQMVSSAASARANKATMTHDVALTILPFLPGSSPRHVRGSDTFPRLDTRSRLVRAPDPSRQYRATWVMIGVSLVLSSTPYACPRRKPSRGMQVTLASDYHPCISENRLQKNKEPNTRHD